MSPKIAPFTHLSFQGRETQREPCDHPKLKRWNWESEEVKEDGTCKSAGGERCIGRGYSALML